MFSLAYSLATALIESYRRVFSVAYPLISAIVLLMTIIVTLSGCGHNQNSLRQAEISYNNGNQEELDTIFEIATTAEDPALRIEATQTLGRLQGERIPTMLLQLSQDAVVGEEALKMIGQRQLKHLAPDLIQLFGDKPNPLFMETLVNIGSEESLPYFLHSLKNPDYASLALEGIQRIGGAKEQQAYREIISKDVYDIKIRLMALDLLQLNTDNDRNKLFFGQLMTNTEKTSPLRSAILQKSKQNPDPSYGNLIQPRYKLTNDQENKAYFLSLFAAHNRISEIEAKQILEPKKIRPQPKAKGVKKLLSGLTNRVKIKAVLFAALQDGAKRLGLKWDDQKSQNLYDNIDRSFTNMAKQNEFRFQKVYALLRKRYLDADFTKLQSMIANGLQHGEIMDMIILNISQRYQNADYAIAYLGRFFNIDALEARVLYVGYNHR